ncbi:hypothetical protein JN531_017170 (plasmid) [Flagellatimonas centrodinii]|uniref:hypothetical protein n=1 Tax=Flagellatimonas centrodinii TaxID=2806210 RepID=UPI001FEE5903|nr:hypothetical protein [Flagellatimonas centrodinii]ULQ48364.1 hypothetical protein JN531_017170 [Flagellatimonas centrodinii]
MRNNLLTDFIATTPKTALVTFLSLAAFLLGIRFVLDAGAQGVIPTFLELPGLLVAPMWVVTVCALTAPSVLLALDTKSSWWVLGFNLLVLALLVLDFFRPADIVLFGIAAYVGLSMWIVVHWPLIKSHLNDPVKG